MAVSCNHHGMWEGKLHHGEFAQQVKLKSQSACVTELSHRVTMKCHSTTHQTENASRSFIFSWPRLSGLPGKICIFSAHAGKI